MRASTLAVLATLATLGGCSPEVPTRACRKLADCFAQEVCVEQRCVTADPSPTGADDATSADTALPDVAPPETDDAGADATP